MKLLVLYRPDSEYSRNVENFIRDLRQVHNLNDHNLKVIDYDSREGVELAAAYGIVTQPAIVTVDEGGGYIKHWEGGDLPLQAEVTGYVHDSLEA